MPTHRFLSGPRRHVLESSACVALVSITVAYEGSVDQCDARRGLTKHPVDRPDLRIRLPEVLSLCYTMRQKAHALDYLEAVIRYVTSASKHQVR